MPIPAIIVVAYNRPRSLSRLLFSLDNAQYSSIEIPLIISIDKSQNNEVERVADNFKWKNGTKKIIKHENNLGLRKHILACGNLTSEYESVIILEDDMYVSQYFYSYAQQALNFYDKEERVCGISLYAYNFNFIANLNFYPLNDSYSTYFVQHASSLGQIWSKKHWEGFYRWYVNNDKKLDQNLPIPDSVLRWPESSWKKYFIAYMVIHDLYFVFPKVSLTTNFSLDIGTHISGDNNNVQVPILFNETSYCFAPYNTESLKYDVYFELDSSIIKKYNNFFSNFDFTVDLYGKKEISKIRSEYLISTKKCIKKIKSFSIQMVPIELNILNNIEGYNIFFAKTKDFDKKPSFKNTYLLTTTLQKKINRQQFFLYVKKYFYKMIKIE